MPTSTTNPDNQSTYSDNQSFQFIFVSTCYEAWGGSEELWSESARRLRKQGFRVSAFKHGLKHHSRIETLRTEGIKVRDIGRLVPLLKIKVYSTLVLANLLANLGLTKKANQLAISSVRNKTSLTNFRSDKLRASKSKARGLPGQGFPSLLVVISQGDNFDGVEVAKFCSDFNLPYVLITQKASDLMWPHGIKRQAMQQAYQKALSAFFVSYHNRSLTEAQIGFTLHNAEVVRNPHRASVASILPYPPVENDGFKIACVARFWVLDKGQDILLRVLAQDKWKNRNLQVSFYGQGVDRQALIEMSQLLDIKNISFPGFANNVLDIWRQHHALVLPSRAEGLPIALVEAMMCGRLGIVTDVGGAREVVEDGVTGFIAASCCIVHLDNVLEEAWQRRYDWQAMGQQAFASIRTLVPPDPQQLLADRLVQMGHHSNSHPTHA